MINFFQQYFSGFILFIVSVVIMTLTGWLGLAYATLTLLLRFRLITLLKGLNKLFLQVAVSIDQLGNVIMQRIFNDLLIKKASPDKFGSEDETISSVIGKNQLSGMLTGLGRAINWVLNKIDSNHSLNSIEYGKRMGMKV